MNTPDFAKMVPGFDFLHNLMKGAGAGLPGMSQWIAPTLDAEEVDKRIQELRTVQFWLEQNAKMLGATIQALEVQRMTLATLRTMNLPMNELRESMKLDPDALSSRAAAPATPAAAPTGSASPDPAPPAVDPLQWWGALTRQFTELAANAIKDNPVEAATQMAGAAFQQAVQPMADAAAGAAVAAASPPARAAAKAAAKKGGRSAAKKAAPRAR